MDKSKWEKFFKDNGYEVWNIGTNVSTYIDNTVIEWIKFIELWGYYEVFEEASKNNKERQFIIPKHIQNEYEQWSKKNTFNLTYKKYSNWINEASKRVNKFLNISVNEKITSHS
ncbi:hypothetical protein, partial [Mycoplasmopsis cynos]|uniref:hypothetical protein n=1 Tax=Mycoplasmopsis cynos TaxID=171284 RepID=UPI001143FF54